MLDSSLRIAAVWLRQNVGTYTLCVIALPILLGSITFWLSSLQFHRAVQKGQSGAKPPTAPYWLPGLYHLPGLVRGPSACVQRLLYVPSLNKCNTC